MRQIEVGYIEAHERVSTDMYRMVVALPQMAKQIRPGQFIHVRVSGYHMFLRRPFSPSRVDVQAGTIEMIYRVVGRGTEWLRTLCVGSALDCLGPLGSTFHLDGKLLVVGGGVGIAPVLYAAWEASQQEVVAVIGGRHRDELFWRDYFPPNIGALHLATDDGSIGLHGFTTDIVADLLMKTNFDRVLTCGPEIMMKKVAELAHVANIPCEVSLEQRMGCGTGGCLACVVDMMDGTHRKVCTDGPVFDSREVLV